MTHLSNGIVVTDIDAQDHNDTLTEQGYAIRHIEDWHGSGQSCIIWDAPGLTDADLPF